VKGASGVAAVLGVARRGFRRRLRLRLDDSGPQSRPHPRRHALEEQLVEIIAVISLSFFLMGPIIALHEANLATGGIGGRALPAPAGRTHGPTRQGYRRRRHGWGLLAIGGAFGIALLLCGARRHDAGCGGDVSAFRHKLGHFAGGVIQWVGSRLIARLDETRRRKAEDAGTLLASGLIAGEAIVGILLAVLFLTGVSSLTHAFTGLDELPFYGAWGGWLSLAAFATLAWLLIWVPLRRGQAETSARSEAPPL